MPDTGLQDHYARRAREERDRASVSENSNAAQAHLRLAEEYDRRAKAIQPIVWGTGQPE